ncbi:hypothetical protein [Azospirillum sp. B510]|uniref:hypothetical protein n=1 Tax=Azospirillum sp. (strain B510) TaxID=137722 RepID=UPI0002ED1866|nr:hypothetical protein [Azospirillum sp. B510]
MRLVVAFGVLSVAMALSGCASTTNGKVQAFGNGTGSENGNYVQRAAGETRGPAGERCTVFTWDRPVSKDFAVRLTSESCDSRAHPFWMDSRELSRTVIPLSQSNVESGVTDP